MSERTKRFLDAFLNGYPNSDHELDMQRYGLYVASAREDGCSIDYDAISKEVTQERLEELQSIGYGLICALDALDENGLLITFKEAGK